MYAVIVDNADGTGRVDRTAQPVLAEMWFASSAAVSNGRVRLLEFDDEHNFKTLKTKEPTLEETLQALRPYLDKWVRYESTLPMPKRGAKLQRSMYGIAVGIVEGKLLVNWGDGCELGYRPADVKEVGLEIIGDKAEFSY